MERATRQQSRALGIAVKHLWHFWGRFNYLADLPGFVKKTGAQVGGVEVKRTYSSHIDFAPKKKLQVPECTTSRPVQAAHYFKWEHE